MLIVNSANFSGTVVPKTYSFNVIISSLVQDPLRLLQTGCNVTKLTIETTIPDMTYSINQVALTTVAFTVT